VEHAACHRCTSGFSDFTTVVQPSFPQVPIFREQSVTGNRREGRGLFPFPEKNLDLTYSSTLVWSLLDSFSMPRAFRDRPPKATIGTLSIDDIGPPTPRLPQPRWTRVGWRITMSIGLHLVVAIALSIVVHRSTTPMVALESPPSVHSAPDVRHIVFIARSPIPGGGGGGGGNRQTGPIRRAEGIGSDKITLRIAKKPLLISAPSAVEVPTLPRVLLDAQPLASGSVELVGLPVGGVTYGTSTGPGTGGGVGEGVGTGIGSGRGPGIGPGSGGGIGGGVYRPGGAVAPPRVITEVKPTYTNDALFRKIQGTVILELIVKQDGRPFQIRVVHSLDPKGLDQQAILAASQWRFEPGRLAGTPVDVLVTIMLDFWIR